MRNYIVFAFLMSFLTFCIIGEVPVKAKAASIYDIPDGADSRRYLAQMYPTFGDFLQFASAVGTDNLFYEFIRRGSGASAWLELTFRYDLNDNSYFITFTMPNALDYSFANVSFSDPASPYASYTSSNNSFSLSFKQFYANYPDIPLYETVKEAADLNADSVRKFRLILFAFSALLFIVLGRRF